MILFNSIQYLSMLPSTSKKWQLSTSSKKGQDQIDHSCQQIFDKKNKSLFNGKETNLFQNKKKLSNKSELFQSSEILQDIDNVLFDNKNVSRQQVMLRIKVQELQKFCYTLSKDNEKLTDKIQQLLNQKQSNTNQTIFIDELSEMNNDFTDVQNSIKVYRTSLIQYQKTVKEQIRSKDYQIQKLTKKLKINNQELEICNSRIHKIEKYNKECQDKIQQLQRQLKMINHYENEKKLCSKNNNYQCEQFDENNRFERYVQEELENLIQKLVNELDHEKSLKLKMEGEIKRLSRKIPNLVKELQQKNQIISQFQSLKKNCLQDLIVKHQPVKPQTTYNFSQSRQSSQPTLNTKAISRHNLSCLKSFTLADILNGQIIIDDYQKMVLTQKLVDYYQFKAKNRLFTETNSKDLLILNYHSQYLNMLSVRETNRLRKSTLGNFARLLWNMSFNVVSLLNQTNETWEKSEAYQITKRNIVDVLEKIVKTPQEQMSLNCYYFEELSQYLEDYFIKQSERH